MKLPEKSKRTEFRELAGGEQEKNDARGEAAEARYPPAHLALRISSMWLEFRELAAGEQKNGARGEAAEAPYPPAHLALRFSSMWLAICIL